MTTPEPAWLTKVKENASCTFCMKPRAQVHYLIHGPSDHFICDECVALCGDILREKGHTTLDTDVRAILEEARSGLVAYAGGEGGLVWEHDRPHRPDACTPHGDSGDGAHRERERRLLPQEHEAAVTPPFTPDGWRESALLNHLLKYVYDDIPGDDVEVAHKIARVRIETILDRPFTEEEWVRFLVGFETGICTVYEVLRQDGILTEVAPPPIEDYGTVIHESVSLNPLALKVLTAVRADAEAGFRLLGSSLENATPAEIVAYEDKQAEADMNLMHATMGWALAGFPGSV